MPSLDQGVARSAGRLVPWPPGADSTGLGTHLDPGILDLRMTEAYQKAFRHLFDGHLFDGAV
ncbi:hypothetical protein ABZ807_15790 [Micromonospora sp. NPDC047548]|uniref:hypothetical protein n=1 Tax=Micromonospora sp. NPDC047548 TaxID=3155624 RepID=UPI0033ED0233